MAERTSRWWPSKWWSRTDRLTSVKKDRQVVCKNCRTEIPGNTNLCPKCGLSPGPETVTNLPPWRGRGKKGE